MSRSVARERHAAKRVCHVIRDKLSGQKTVNRWAIFGANRFEILDSWASRPTCRCHLIRDNLFRRSVGAISQRVMNARSRRA